MASRPAARIAPRASGNVGAVVGPGDWGRSGEGSASGRLDELAYGVLRPPGVVSVGLREGIEALLEANDGDGDGQTDEVARQVAGSHLAAVLVVGDVANVVHPILDAPVPAHEREDDLGGGLLGGGSEVRPCTVSCSTLPVLTMRRSRSIRKATWR